MLDTTDKGHFFNIFIRVINIHRYIHKKIKKLLTYLLYFNESLPSS